LEPGTAGLELLLGKLRDWSDRTASVIQALDVQIKDIQDHEKTTAEAAKEYESERITIATQVAEVCSLGLGC
jgi:hypothetical protein